MHPFRALPLRCGLFLAAQALVIHVASAQVTLSLVD